MVRMTITFLVMVILFLGGVIIGVEQASLGMINVRGFSAESFEEAVQTKSDQENYEVRVMGKEFHQVPFEEKQSTYEAMQETQGIQKAAVVLGKGVEWGYNQMIFVIYQLVQVFF